MPDGSSPWEHLGPMAKAYDPRAVEDPVYRLWNDRGYFKPSDDPHADPFTITMPPPNVTGSLHLGHALESAIQDALVRWRRMQGHAALWVPGTDHAGIATQLVVERNLLEEEGLTRHELGREQFVARVWDWVRQYGDVIAEQRKRMGASCDWNRARFTLDPGPSRAVRRTFVNLYKKGLIYRGSRLVNWCPRCQTALSDLEVVHQEEDAPLYQIRYPFASGEGHVVVATTRPETMLGDTAVAAHPDDERYRSLVGKELRLPLAGRIIPIIADDAVDPEFGTGALKVTPAHDHADFEIGERHGLDAVAVIGLDGRMTADAGKYEGRDRDQARRDVVADLESLGLLESVEPHAHSVGLCDRCKTVIEPVISLQWWVAMSTIKEASIKAVREGRIRFVPERFTRVYFNWMEGLRDWCVSRQLWWGHRIPVWYCDECGETIVAEEDPSGCTTCGEHRLRQDEDVLDTWFSSGLWPHSTLGWPDEDSSDLQRFYPTSVLECGRDILFLWVSRMITLSIENTGKIPFRTVYLHGLLQDPEGAKMSKSKGNVVDPLELIDTYGTDALRFALTTGVSPGNESRLSPPKMEAGRNFANKLWNAARFVVNAIEAAEEPIDWQAAGKPAHVEDRWIVSRQNRLADGLDQHMGEYQIGEAQRLLYDFIWSEFCDWYLELAKVRLRSGEGPTPLPYLGDILEKTLRLLHPFMPFVTEEIWQHLKAAFSNSGGPRLGESIMIAPYPDADPELFDEQAEADLAILMDVIRAIRNVRAETRVPQGETVEAAIASQDASGLLQRELPAIAALAHAAPDVMNAAGTSINGDDAVTIVLHRATVSVSLAGVVDIAEAKARLEDDLANATAARAQLDRRLKNHDFLAKAPEDVVEKERTRLAETDDRISRLRQLVGMRD